MEYTQAEILQTVAMTEMEHLDVRTVTLGLSLLDCTSDSMAGVAQKAGDKIRAVAARLVPTVDEIGEQFGIRVANKRISITPVSLITEGLRGDVVQVARAIDDAAGTVVSISSAAIPHWSKKAPLASETRFLDSIPEALSTTQRLCSSVNAATTRAGINMDVVGQVGRIIKDAAERTRDHGGLACAKFVCFANAVEDNPFMAGAFHGVSEAGAVINVGVSGPGVVHHAVRHAGQDLPLQDLAETIKKLSFKLARAGELVGREAARRLGIPFGIIDLSLAPTPVPGDSVANIIEAMGFERAGTHGTTAALALLTDAVKKGGAMASGSVGGMSGAFIPVSEDAGMIEAAQLGALSLGKARSMDQRVLRRHRHGCGAGFDFGRNDRRDHRGRDGGRSDEQQDHRGADYSGAWTRCWRDGGVWRFAGQRADHAGECFFVRRFYQARRKDTRADSLVAKLAQRAQIY